ncbi:MAG: hypothetical protein DBY24_03270 [Prevotellaceae bacterium]|nr:MAG: hypothetical protein DBY24_03270 [Prevotellaceae bacterium]
MSVYYRHPKLSFFYVPEPSDYVKNYAGVRNPHVVWKIIFCASCKARQKFRKSCAFLQTAENQKFTVN